ncbi:MAG: hypothetical protein QNJ22_17605 [Desulfosarcinaceae bacterium]|nr:hypothetical protein [Desulfosarcinaceae bacterium]
MNRRTFLSHCALGSAGLTTLLQGCKPTSTASPVFAAGSGDTAAAGDTPSPTPPAIDLAAPGDFETATFALG